MAYDGAMQILSFISFGIFVWIGSLQVVNGALSVGEFVSFNALVALSPSDSGSVAPPTRRSVAGRVVGDRSAPDSGTMSDGI